MACMHKTHASTHACLHTACKRLFIFGQWVGFLILWSTPINYLVFSWLSWRTHYFGSILIAKIYFFETALFFLLFTYYYYYSKVRVWARHFFNLFWLIRKMKYWVNNKSLPFFNFLHIGIDGLLNVKKVEKKNFFFIKKVFFPLFWCLVLMGGVWRGVERRDWSNR